MSETEALFDVDGTIAVLTFNRPQARNALTWAMYDALVAACDRVDADPAVRVFVTAPRATRSPPAPTSASSPASRPATTACHERRLDAVIDRLERVRVPTIAQVHGVAAGGGCAIALACDLRVCTPAARFGVPIARTLGNCLSAANYARLVDLVGRRGPKICSSPAASSTPPRRPRSASRPPPPSRIASTKRCAALAGRIAAHAPHDSRDEGGRAPDR